MEIKGFTDKLEYKFLNENKNLGDHICLIGYGGSIAYGTNVPTSDIDIRGFATRNRTDILLDKDFEEVVNKETDTTIYSLDKMFKLLSECNPNCVEILGLREQDYLYRNEIGQMVLDNKQLFLSNRCVFTFGGYARQQLYKLKQKGLVALSDEEMKGHIAKVITSMRDHLYTSYGDIADHIKIRSFEGKLVVDMDKMDGIPIELFIDIQNEITNVLRTYNKNSSRNEKAIAHGKINKHAMHLIRLMMMACDLLTKGEIITYRTDEHDLLMAIRNGEFSVDSGSMSDKFWKLYDEWEARFNEAQTRSVLPEKPDMDGINALRAKINEKVIMG